MLMFTWQRHYQNQDFRPIIGQNQHFPGHHLATHFFQGFGCSWYIYISLRQLPPRLVRVLLVFPIYGKIKMFQTTNQTIITIPEINGCF